jgi:hypothetical protein
MAPLERASPYQGTVTVLEVSKETTKCGFRLPFHPRSQTVREMLSFLLAWEVRQYPKYQLRLLWHIIAGSYKVAIIREYLFSISFIINLWQLFTVHRLGDDSWRKCERCACIRFRRKRRFATTHLINLRKLYSLTTRYSKCLVSSVRVR